MLIRPLDLESLRARFAAAEPFPHIVIDDFIDPVFGRELVQSLPDFNSGLRVGNRFETVNEHKKVQVTDPAQFPAPLQRLLGELHSESFLRELSVITDVPSLEADNRLLGGGLHLTGPRGRLDVHTDFNYLPDVERFRRLNLLLYLNPDWKDKWGGELELWDQDMQRCALRVAPVLGRCVIFATSTKSFHGTRRVTCPKGKARRSFALYYYSHVPPPNFNDQFQGTVFRARPSEWFKGKVLMPLEEHLRRRKARKAAAEGDGSSSS